MGKGKILQNSTLVLNKFWVFSQFRMLHTTTITFKPQRSLLFVLSQVNVNFLSDEFNS